VLVGQLLTTIASAGDVPSLTADSDQALQDLDRVSEAA
jgi:hypothetical protein